MTKALLVMDIINDIAHESGKVGKDGFYIEAKKRKIIDNTKKVINHARELKFKIIYVVIGFSENYEEWNEKSLLFKKVKSDRQVMFNTWGTQVCDDIAPQKGDLLITKNRIDPFYNTNLELVLRNLNINELYLTGISTDLVILSTVLSAHDRDFKVHTIEDCTSASNKQSHDNAINIISHLSSIVNVNEFLKKGLRYEGDL
ncbi:TPA: cysteine hydrolase [Staphylococcus aureus]|nr:cysteine hydrolase [Staphylococcus aureus]HDJ2895713.1 cysteine hydrolase [Staphylococcus aureus]HDJ3124242.1 cysteine hydrolase [Staphylococcus aureus]HDJ3129814.1 cysteine hydrolase [Staphylococcus aureus]HDJ3180754.1 cysteine hydrolase [Staphylococcus aureus]